MAPRVVKTLDALQKAIAAYLLRTDAPVLAIDGMDGSGKSWLAERLAASIHAAHLNLDEFLNQKRGGFLDHLRYDELAAAVNRARDGGAVIIEGVCVLEVLQRLGVKPSVHIYVKHLVAGCIWQPEGMLSMASVSAALAREEEECRRFAKLSGDPVEAGEDLLGGLVREVIAYHYTFRPHESPDIVYERSDDPT